MTRPVIDPRTDALAQLMFSMRRALVERRQVIEIGEIKFRFQRRNEEFDDGDMTYRALQSGVFAYFSAAADGKEVPGRWIHLGSSDDLEDLTVPYLQQMSARELEELRVTISASAVLQALSEDRQVARRVAPPAPMSVAGSGLFARPMKMPAEAAAQNYARNAAGDAAEPATPTVRRPRIR